MYHYMHLDLSLIRVRNERMRSEMSKVRLVKRFRKHSEKSGPRLLASFLGLTSILHPLRETGTAGR